MHLVASIMLCTLPPFEQVRADWLRTLGVDHELVLANVSCTFFRPLSFPADTEVALYAGHLMRVPD